MKKLNRLDIKTCLIEEWQNRQENMSMHPSKFCCIYKQGSTSFFLFRAHMSTDARKATNSIFYNDLDTVSEQQ